MSLCLTFVAETYASYQIPFIGLTVLYFVVWLSTSRRLAKGADVARALEGSSSPGSSDFGYLDRFAKLTFPEVTSFYVASVSLLFVTALLVAGHTFRAWMIGAFGFGLAIGLTAVSERLSK